jgi:carbonic anhydrase
MTPEKSLSLLIEGNKRYVKDELQHPNRCQFRRESITARQTPFAIILGCSDSRVSPEIIFDQGLGDLFVVRVAGNVVGPVELASIDYSALILLSSLIVVMGHESCGAVTAVLNGQTKGIEAIARKIAPAIAQSAKKSGNLLENAIKDNVRKVVKQLRNSSILSELIKDKKIDVIGGYYHLTSGEVEFLDRLNGL